MHVLAPLAAAIATASLLAGCPRGQEWDPRSLGDLMPPVFAGVSADAPDTVQIRFDEPVRLVEGSLLFQPPVEATEVRAAGTSLCVLTGAQTPGREYRVEATVEDSSGNSTSIVARYYGHNPEVPRLLINEFITRGSGSHPDLVEIKAMGDGDLAGVTLYQGTPSDWTDRLVFPACRVRGGDFILVHFRPQGIPEERDETDARDLSGGLDASPAALDFWVPAGQGLSGNNGVIAVYDRPGGDILDGVLYSDRTSESDSAYGGFGSASVLARAQELVANRGWLAGEATVRPEDAVSPEGSTGTRSIARSRTSVDTNARADWHITPTRGASWGAENTDECWSGAAR